MSLVHVDCNNFFVSCERLFEPKLLHRPVIILSGDNGCIVARSNEAKTLGIAMGAPFFQYEALCQKYGVVVLSSNFSLYSDISRRVMAFLRSRVDKIEMYSVDEAFFILGNATYEEMLFLRGELLRCIGIPVSIGVASTKTLTKVATSIAKKSTSGVFVLSKDIQEEVLRKLDVEEVWGIGARLAASLKAKEVYSAFCFANKEDLWIKKYFGVVGLRMAWELRGMPCFEVNDMGVDPNKSISTVRSLKLPVSSLEILQRILAGDAASVATKLRRQKSVAAGIMVVLKAQDGGYESDSVFTEPTSYTPTIITYVKELAALLYRRGVCYKKAGVVLFQFSSEEQWQRTLFSDNSRKMAVMRVVDKLNTTLRKDAVFFASVIKRPKASSKVLQKYTSDWGELPTVIPRITHLSYKEGKI